MQDICDSGPEQGQSRGASFSWVTAHSRAHEARATTETQQAPKRRAEEVYTWVHTGMRGL